ncbi:hypothetical protein MAR_002122 [Mya arenaria]|uniref:Uncharacterized protein n=1 Tax=Mya arenaria TaxID=6604 RepID=A0ABY7FHD6_MYAAR|nr:hypothetical protein MAR_002122 [Mya arenaria]
MSPKKRFPAMFIRQQNDRMEQGRVFPDGVTPKQQPSGSRRPQSSKVYADINEETMEYYHHICERNSPDNNDEINVTNDPDIEIMPSEDFTDESESRRIVTKSEDKDDLDSTEETGRSVTQFNGDLDHVCKSDSTSGVNPKRSELVSMNDVLDLKTHCQINMAENRQMKAAKCCNEGGNIFVDLGQFQVDYIHAIASEECELLDNKNRSSNCTSSL